MVSDLSRFNCPNCDALYNLVRVEVSPSADRELECLRCGGPLQSREGRFALKYLLIEPRRTERASRRKIG